MTKRRMGWLAAACVVLAGCDNGAAPDADPAALLASGDLAGAERMAKRELRSDPDNPELRLVLGRIYLEAGDGNAALAAFERARAAGADGPEVREGLARSLLLQQRPVDALRHLESPAGAALPGHLLELRLEARLRIPLARPAELFDDTRHLLAAGYEPAALESLTGAPGVIAANAVHVRRALAYATCPRALPPASAGLAPPPAWANLAEEGRRVLRVGPGRELETPSAAARVAQDGDIVDIDAGAYPGDAATWNARGLWLRAAGGRVVLDSGGRVAENKGIWVIRGDDTIVEGVRFTGARTADRNGAGIRLLARNLWVRYSEFHDNEDGILTFNEPGGEIVIEHSVFTENGAGDGLSHNVYVGRTGRLVFRFNWSSGVRVGHLLKSRAEENYILYNRFDDGDRGDSSYTIDLPEGGFALVLGNELQQGPRTVNNHMVSIGSESPTGRDHRFVFAYNTFYNHSSPATFIRDATGAGVTLVNNVFAGAPADLDAVTVMRAGNAFAATGGLAGQDEGDFSLAPSARFIDGGEPLEAVGEVGIVPEFEYVHPAGGRPRRTVWRPDPGAHEFCGWPDLAL